MKKDIYEKGLSVSIVLIYTRYIITGFSDNYLIQIYTTRFSVDNIHVQQDLVQATLYPYIHVHNMI